MSNLLADIETFCTAQEMAESQFGLLALNDKNFVSDLRDGRDIRFSTSERVRQFMVGYRQADAA